MGWFKRISMGLKFLGWVKEAAVEADKAAARRFTDEWAQNFRWALEKIIVRLYLAQDKGVLALFEADNRFVRCLTIILKSDAILRIERAKNNSELATAEKALINKDPERTIRYLEKVMAGGSA